MENKIKRILSAFLMILASWTILYLLGAFGNAETNIACWSDGSRAVIAILGGLIAFVTIIDTIEKKY